MTTTILFWFRIVVYAILVYTVFTYIRSSLKKGYWIPQNRKDLKDLGGDLLTFAGGFFVLWMLQQNYQKPLDAVLSKKQKTFPDFSFALSPEGQPVRLSDYRGKIVLLNLWATWFPPCRREMPDLDALHRKYRDSGMVVLALSDEDKTTVHAYLQKHDFQFLVGTYQGGLETISAVNTRPSSILIGKEGQVLDMVVGARGLGFFEDWVEEWKNKSP
jgi:thiol-disulfide isomerase/thioredoxin